MKYLRALWSLLTEGVFVDVPTPDGDTPLPPPPRVPWEATHYREPCFDPRECPICHARADEPCDAGLHS